MRSHRNYRLFPALRPPAGRCRQSSLLRTKVIKCGFLAARTDLEGRATAVGAAVDGCPIKIPVGTLDDTRRELAAGRVSELIECRHPTCPVPAKKAAIGTV